MTLEGASIGFFFTPHNKHPSCPAKGSLTTNEDLPRVLHTKKVRKFAVVIAIVNHKVGALIVLE